MAEIDDRIAELEAEVATNTGVGDSVVTLVMGLLEQLAVGANPVTLQKIADMKAAIQTDTQKLQDAILAATPQDPNNPANRRKP